MKKFSYNENHPGLLKNALPVKNQEVMSFIKKIDTNNFFFKSTLDLKIKDKFLNEYFNWIQTSKLNKITGSSKFNKLSYFHGTSQSFDFFTAEYPTRRFRCFKGDFFYHILSWRNNYKFLFLDNAKIQKNDAVIISVPFSDNGYIHPKTIDVLKQCDALGVPVMLDFAYYNLVRDLNFSLNHSSIKAVTFSLSKGFFPLDRFRIGIRCKKEFSDDPVDFFNSLDMVNKPGVAIGYKIIKKFSPDYNQNKFRKKQLETCSLFGLEPSNCVTFGLGDKRYSKFNRGSLWNRVCLSNFLP